jgi:hypothetical protein
VESSCLSSRSLPREDSQHNDDTEVPAPVEGTNSTVAGNKTNFMLSLIVIENCSN